MAEQLKLAFETADTPQGDGRTSEVGLPTPAGVPWPKSKDETRTALPAVSMEDIADLENLARALEQVVANRGAPGPNRQTVDQVRGHKQTIIDHLRVDLLAGNYRPGCIRRVWIPKAGGGQRGLGIPDVIDRVVQQALHQKLSPVFDPKFHSSSHGFRPGKSCHTAIAEAQTHINKNTWVVDIDLEKFFDTVPHDRLMARLEARIGDRRVLTVIRRLLRAKVVMPNGVVVNVDEGTPQGGPLSPLLSNIVLDELDIELTRRGHRFVRYADDCNVYMHSRRAAERVMTSIVRFIESRMGLKVNRAKSAVARPIDRHFLGFRMSRNQLRPSARTEKRLKEKVRELTPRTWGQSLRACIHAINAYARGWVGFFGVCTHLGGLTNWVDGHLRRRLRAILLTQWKKRRTLVRRLTLLGTPIALARRVSCGRSGRWRISKAKAVCFGLTNAFFEKVGLLSFQSLWKEHQPSLAVADEPA